MFLELKDPLSGNVLRALNLFLVLKKCTNSLASAAYALNRSESGDLVVYV